MKNFLQKEKTKWNSILVVVLFLGAFVLPNLKAQISQTYSYTGSIQTFTVPSCVSSITIDARGAQGGGSYNGAGGLGARMVGTYTTTVGTVYSIVVGQMGLLQVGGNAQNSSGGGGGSFVYTSGPNLLVAAGGGGGKCNYTGSTALHAGAAGTVVTAGNQASNSGALGGTAGLGGAAGLWSNVPCAGGGAGWLSAGGGPYGGLTLPSWAGGPGYCGGGGGGCGGVGGYGGGGGGGNHYGGGGGGGGYSGGGGGTDPTHGGGGGSFSSGTNQSNTSGFQTGDGLVIITYNFNGNGVVSNASPSLICSGTNATLTASGQNSYTWSTGSNASTIIVSPNTTTSYTVQGTNSVNCVSSSVITVTVNNAPPTLSVVSTASSVCPTNTVIITASGAINYTWTGGVTNAVPFSPLVTTIYTVSGQNGCGISTATTGVTVTPLPVVAIAQPTLVCSGTTSSLSAGGATTYTWQPGNLVGANVSVNPLSNTTYTVVGATGSCAGISTIAIATNPNPTVTVSSTHFSLCAGESATLTATGAIGYTWTPGGIGSSIVVSPIIPTAYNVVGVNSFSCYANANIPVIAYAGPNMNIAASTTLVCTGGSVSLNASGATTYSWSTGAITPVTVINPVSSAVYTVVGSTPNSPCATTKTVQVDVFTATISVSSPTAICIGDATTLNASGATTYNWSNGGSGSNVVVNPVSTTGYTVTGNSTIGGTSCSSTGTTMVTVNPLPTVTASSTRTNICRFEFANITAGGANTYLWSNASTGTVLSVNPNTNTTYSVIGTDANGCKASASIQIKVFQCVGLSETTVESNLLQIYPNPSSGEFNIRSTQDMNLELINELGQVVMELSLNAGNNHLVNVKGLSVGIYFISNKNIALRQKLIIQY